MKFTTVLVAIFATAVAAGAIEQRSDNKPPKCAKKCIKDSAKVSDCGKKDFACMCSSKPFHQAVVPCIKDECSKPEMYVPASLPPPSLPASAIP